MNWCRLWQMFLLSNFKVHLRTQSLTRCPFFYDWQVPPRNPHHILLYIKKRQRNNYPSFSFYPLWIHKDRSTTWGPSAVAWQPNNLALFFFFCLFFPRSFLFFKAGINRCLRLYVCLSLRCLVLSAKPRALRSPQPPHQESGSEGNKGKEGWKAITVRQWPYTAVTVCFM